MRNMQQASLNKYISSHPTHYHQFQLKCLSQELNFRPSNLYTPPNPALTQSTSPLISEPPFDNSNIICLLVVSPNVKSTYTLMPSRISWHSTPCPAHSPFALGTSGKPNHIVRATNSEYTKPRYPLSRARSTTFTKPRAHTEPITYNTIPQKDNIIPYMAQLRYFLNSQPLVIFFPFATIPATSHYPVFTDTHSLLYGMLTILLHFITNTFFLTLLPLSPPPSASTLFLNHTVSPIPCTPPSLNALTKKMFAVPLPSSPIHSPDLGCVRAQRIILLGRFLV